LTGAGLVPAAVQVVLVAVAGLAVEILPPPKMDEIPGLAIEFETPLPLAPRL
jgi:hypothetical protein